MGQQNLLRHQVTAPVATSVPKTPPSLAIQKVPFSVRLDDKFRISFWALQLYPKVSREVAKSANCYVMHLQGAL